MTPTLRAIHDTCNALGTYPPRVKHLPHAITVSFRNADGHRVTLSMDPDTTPEAAADRIRLAYKTKAEAGAMTTDEMLARINDAD